MADEIVVIARSDTLESVLWNGVVVETRKRDWASGSAAQAVIRDDLHHHMNERNQLVGPARVTGTLDVSPFVLRITPDEAYKIAKSWEYRHYWKWSFSSEVADHCDRGNPNYRFGLARRLYGFRIEVLSVPARGLFETTITPPPSGFLFTSVVDDGADAPHVTYSPRNS